MTDASDLHLTAVERERVARVAEQVARGAEGVPALLEALDDASWTVRRAVVAGLASLADAAAEPLAGWLATARSSEHAIAAAVDALSEAGGGRATQAALALIDHPDPAVASDGARILGRRRANEHAAQLAALLAHDDDNVAMAAIEALGAIGGAVEVDALIGALQGPSFFRRFSAIQVLSRSGDPRALTPLVALLDDELYRGEVVRALGRTGSPRAAAPLLALAAQTDPVATRLAALALADLLASAAWTGAGERVNEALRGAGSEARSGLALAADSASVEEARAIARALGAVGDAGSVPVLTAQLESADLRLGATAALGELVRRDPAARAAALAGSPATLAAVLPAIGARDAAPAIRALLADSDPEIRARACDALGRIGDTDALDGLFALLADPLLRVGLAAAGAIQSLGDAGTPARLQAALASDEVGVRRHALRIVGYLGCRDVLPAVLAAIDDPVLGEQALGALGALDDPQVDDVLVARARDPRPGLRGAALRAAATRGGPALIAALEAGLDDPAPWVRYYACQGLGRLAVHAAAPALVARLDDDLPHVRVAALEALGRLDDPAARAAMLAVAQGDDPDARRVALVGLAAVPSPAARALLDAATRDADLATQLIALAGLAQIADPAALAALAAAARDGSPELREAALQLLVESPAAGAATHLVELALAAPAAHPVHAAVSRPGPTRVAALAARLADSAPGPASVLAAALARMHDHGATDALLAALSAANPASRRAAAIAVIALDAPGGRAAVARLAVEDPDPEVRRLCLAASHE